MQNSKVTKWICVFIYWGCTGWMAASIVMFIDQHMRVAKEKKVDVLDVPFANWLISLVFSCTSFISSGIWMHVLICRNKRNESSVTVQEQNDKNKQRWICCICFWISVMCISLTVPMFTLTDIRTKDTIQTYNQQVDYTVENITTCQPAMTYLQSEEPCHCLLHSHCDNGAWLLIENLRQLTRYECTSFFNDSQSVSLIQDVLNCNIHYWMDVFPEHTGWLTGLIISGIEFLFFTLWMHFLLFDFYFGYCPSDHKYQLVEMNPKTETTPITQQETKTISLPNESVLSQNSIVYPVIDSF